MQEHARDQRAKGCEARLLKQAPWHEGGFHDKGVQSPAGEAQFIEEGRQVRKDENNRDDGEPSTRVLVSDRYHVRDSLRMEGQTPIALPRSPS